MWWDGIVLGMVGGLVFLAIVILLGKLLHNRIEQIKYILIPGYLDQELNKSVDFDSELQELIRHEERKKRRGGPLG